MKTVFLVLMIFNNMAKKVVLAGVTTFGGGVPVFDTQFYYG